MIFYEMFDLQIKGIAMGTIFALTYVALAMGYHKVKLYIIIKSKFTRPVSDRFERNSKRFLNDCFIRSSRN